MIKEKILDLIAQLKQENIEIRKIFLHPEDFSALIATAEAQVLVFPSPTTPSQNLSVKFLGIEIRADHLVPRGQICYITDSAIPHLHVDELLINPSRRDSK